MNYATSGARKKSLVQEAKRRPCVDCEAVGLPDMWPLEAKQLDHLPGYVKRMHFTNTPGTGVSATVYPSYLKFSVHDVIVEILHTETVCANHHFSRTVKRMRRGYRQEQAGQMVLTPVADIAAESRESWYRLVLRHNPLIWD